MRTHKEFLKRIEGYVGIEFIYIPKVGCIAWQMSTGDNIEIVFIEVASPRTGQGRLLIKLMCQQIKPFHSVFVFRLRANKAAGEFYRKLGFKETVVPRLYAGDDAVVGVTSYQDLIKQYESDR